MFMEIYVTSLSAVNHDVTRIVCDPGSCLDIREPVGASLGSRGPSLLFQNLTCVRERIMLLLITRQQALGYKAVFVVYVGNLSSS